MKICQISATNGAKLMKIDFYYKNLLLTVSQNHSTTMIK